MSRSSDSPMNAKQPEDQSRDLPIGSTVYSRASLLFYDFVVHFLTNRLVWRCPAQHLIDHCNSHLTSNHLELGIGSGKLFKKSADPLEFERLAIGDVNSDCLGVAAQTLKDHEPETWKINLINPDEELQKTGKFKSIGMNYVLHCLPVTMDEKMQICDRLISNCLETGGVLFGTTLFPNQNSHWLSKKLMNFYNSKGIFHNLDDSSKAFKDWCVSSGRDYNVFAVGCVGFFSVRKS